MQAPNRWIRQFLSRVGIETRLRRLRAELAAVFPDLQQLRLSEHESGYDSIFYLEGPNERLGVLRLNTPYKRRSPAWPGRPRNILSPRGRLEREWTAYHRLAPAGLSPRPLWRIDDAIVCSYLTAPRLRAVLDQRLVPLEQALTATLAAVGRMHELGVAHLDLTPGSILLDPVTLQVWFIDFKYQALSTYAFDQQRSLDAEFLTLSLLRRGAALKRSLEFETTVAHAFAVSPLASLVSVDAVTQIARLKVA